MLRLNIKMTTNIIPQKLGIYYGWPSAVNGSGGDVNAAAAVFSDYDVVIFGQGLEKSSHADHANTVSIINHASMSSTEVYGYIDATLALNDLQTSIDEWYDMGVKGIFCDRFGYDFSVARSKQREIIWCIHEKGTGDLKAFVNAWNPDDVFSAAVEATYNPSGLETRMGSDDMYLSESFQIVNGEFQDAMTWKTKSDKMVTYKSQFGSKMATVSTWDSRPYDQAKWDYSYYSAVLYNFDVAGFGEENFSATSASLPFRTRKEVHGTKFIGALIENSGVYEQSTNIGIHVDTNTNTASELLD